MRVPSGIKLLRLLVSALAMVVSACARPTVAPTPTADSTAPVVVSRGVNQRPTASLPVPGASVWTPPPRVQATGCISRGGLPDRACTPGAIDAQVNDATADMTICVSGYTAKVRPPAEVTDKIKRQQMAAYGLQGQRLSEYELDHLIPLELGGAPDNIANLWPQPLTGDANAHMKDAVEVFLNREVCHGALPLSEAQFQIATDWLSVYKQNGLTPTR